MKFIDFFSGIGGFTRGMELAGHQCVGHCEIDKFAEASYRSMHTITEAQREYLLTLPKNKRVEEILKGEYLNGEWYANDICRVRADDVPTAECYCFGFPCQPFSISGHRRGFEDTRGTLFFEVMRIAKERQPKYLFAENVAGLLNHSGGGTFTTIITTMAQLGYSVEWQVLNSRHFGVPQHRQRVFIVGHLGNGSFTKVFPFTECCGTPNEVPTTEIGGVNVATSQFKRPKPTNISAPLCARDYKGVRHNDYGTVVMYGNSKSK